MNSLKGLSQWMIAAQERSPATSAMATTIKTYFNPLIGMDLSSSQLTLMCDSGSMMKMIYLQVNFGLIKDPSLNLHNKIEMDKLISAQLGFSGVTHSEQANLSGVTRLYSVAELSDEIPYAPEFGAYVLDPARGNSTVDMALGGTASTKDFV